MHAGATCYGRVGHALAREFPQPALPLGRQATAAKYGVVAIHSHPSGDLLGLFGEHWDLLGQPPADGAPMATSVSGNGTLRVTPAGQFPHLLQCNMTASPSHMPLLRRWVVRMARRGRWGERSTTPLP